MNDFHNHVLKVPSMLYSSGVVFNVHESKGSSHPMIAQNPTIRLKIFRKKLFLSKETYSIISGVASMEAGEALI